MIQEFLNEQFIQITEDANFDKLKKACAEVVKRITKDKAKISTYTLIALDPEVAADNVDLVEVKQIIIENWSTFVNNSKDTAITFIRAVMLEALQTISKERSAACLIWFTGRNIIKYYKLGREKKILTKFLLELGTRIENEVTESWTFSPEAEIKVPEIAVAIIKPTDIQPHLLAAAAQSSVGGENTHWASGNDVNWPTFFATRAGKGIADVLNKAYKHQAAEIKSSQIEFIRQNSLLQMRTQLLWWKEAGYSTSLKAGYNELKDGVLQVILARDYSSFVPEMYPSSVDYFLKEAHQSYRSVEGIKIKISDILKSIEKNSTELKPVLTEDLAGGSRILFVNFIIGLVHGKYQLKQFKSVVGITESTELTFTEFTIWLFHDFHTLKYSSTK